MAADIPTDLLRAVWGYPFFDTLYGRRTAFRYRVRNGARALPVPIVKGAGAVMRGGRGTAGGGRHWLFWDGAVGSEPGRCRTGTATAEPSRARRAVAARRCFLRTIAAFTSSIRARAQPIG